MCCSSPSKLFIPSVNLVVIIIRRHIRFSVNKRGQCIGLTKRPFPSACQVQKRIQRRVRINEFQEHVRFKVIHEIPGADPDDSFLRLNVIHDEVDFAEDMVVEFDVKACENPAVNEGE